MDEKYRQQLSGSSDPEKLGNFNNTGALIYLSSITIEFCFWRNRADIYSSQPDQQSKQYLRNAVAIEWPSSRRRSLHINLNTLTLKRWETNKFSITRNIMRFSLKLRNFFFEWQSRTWIDDWAPEIFLTSKFLRTVPFCIAWQKVVSTTLPKIFCYIQLTVKAQIHPSLYWGNSFNYCHHKQIILALFLFWVFQLRNTNILRLSFIIRLSFKISVQTRVDVSGWTKNAVGRRAVCKCVYSYEELFTACGSAQIDQCVCSRAQPRCGESSAHWNACYAGYRRRLREFSYVSCEKSESRSFVYIMEM